MRRIASLHNHSYHRRRASEVATVDGFQGREASVVLVSATRANFDGALGFVHDPRRLCVALTRARRACVVVGDARTLRASRHWTALLDWSAERGCLLDEAEVTHRHRVSYGIIARSAAACSTKPR